VDRARFASRPAPNRDTTRNSLQTQPGRPVSRRTPHVKRRSAMTSALPPYRGAQMRESRDLHQRGTHVRSRRLTVVSTLRRRRTGGVLDRLADRGGRIIARAARLLCCMFDRRPVLFPCGAPGPESLHQPHRRSLTRLRPCSGMTSQVASLTTVPRQTLYPGLRRTGNGAARTVMPDELTPGAIRDAVSEVLGEPSYSRAASVVAAESPRHAGQATRATRAGVRQRLA
jgi:hypothetical protein